MNLKNRQQSPILLLLLPLLPPDLIQEDLQLLELIKTNVPKFSEVDALKFIRNFGREHVEKQLNLLITRMSNEKLDPIKILLVGCAKESNRAIRRL